MKKAVFALLIIILTGGALAYWFHSRDKLLSERPQAEPPQVQVPPPRDSVAVAKIIISYATMSEVLNGAKELHSFDQGARENMRKVKHMSANVPAPTIRHPFRTVRRDWDVVLFSQDVDYTINVRRTSGFVFSPNGKDIRVSVPL